MRKLSQYITDQDFQCRCGCGRTQPQGIESIIPEYDDIQRILFGIYDLVAGRTKTQITSGYRCPKRNKEIGGATYSPHLWGLAIDFVAEDREKAIEYLKTLQQSINFRIGHKKYENSGKHIHIDVVSLVAIELYTAQKIPLQVFSAYTNVREW